MLTLLYGLKATTVPGIPSRKKTIQGLKKETVFDSVSQKLR